MDDQDITLERMRTFVRVVERANLSAVARELGVSQSTVTRHLNDLEAAVGVPLLSRTTRSVIPTDEGVAYHGRCVQVLGLVEQAGEEARTHRDAAAGVVRVSCTAAFGVLQVAPLIFAFQDRHPDIAVDLNLTDERIDLVKEGVDLAIRLGPLPDGSLRLRRLGRSHRLLVAAPAYLDRHGRPRTPAALEGHEGIRMSNIAGSGALVLEAPTGGRHTVPFGGRITIDHGLAARAALVAGRGVAPAHRWLVDDLLADGRLEVLLPDHRLQDVPLSLLIAPERARVARVRLLADDLARGVAAIPGIAPPS